MHTLATSGDTIDDAYITLRYARNLVDGHGLVFNLGERVEGYTDFGWVLIAAAAMRLGLPPLGVLTLVSFVAGCAMIGMAYVEARRLDDVDAPIPAGTVAGALLVSSAGLAIHTNAGLETILSAALYSAAGVALVNRRPGAFASWCAAAFFVRPEAGLLGVLGTLYLTYASDYRRATLRALLGRFVPILTPYLLWKLWYFHALLPNTLGAKHPDLGLGVRYVSWMVTWGFGLIAASALVADRPFANRSRRAYLVLWALQVVSVALEGGDWMDAYRLLIPSLPWFAIAVDAPIREALRPAWAPRRLASLVVLVALGWWLRANVTSSMVQQQKQAVTLRRDRIRVALARQLVVHHVQSLATFDIGIVGYTAPRIRVVDLAGLTDRAIARLPGGHGQKVIPEALFVDRNPEVVLVAANMEDRSFSYNVEESLVLSPWFARRYRDCVRFVS